MRLNQRCVVVGWLGLVCLGMAGRAAGQLPAGIKSDLGAGVPEGIRVRPGYRVTRALILDKLTPRVRELRFLQFSDDGKTLYCSSRRDGLIYCLRDPDADGVYQTFTTFIKGRRSVQGMDFHDGWLYFQQPTEGSLSRARDTNGDGVADEVQEILPPGTLPKPGGHPYNAVLVTDKQIYVSASDPQNMTDDIDSPNKKIYVFDADGKNKRVFCSGVRNTEKLRYRPGTSDIYGFDHGSDNFGAKYGEQTGKDQPITDLNPPEEFNKYVEGGFYGHPYIMGTGVPRLEFMNRSEFNLVELAGKTTQPEWLVHAHWAVCGWTWLSGDTFGPGHKGDIFFAAHGSWNSIHPVGSCVQRLMFDQLTGKPCGSLTIVDCGSGDSENRRNRPCRPVDCAEAPDGSVVFSSDEPAALYRISKSNATTAGASAR